MAQITLKGTAIETIGNLPNKDVAAPAFTLVKRDLAEASLADYKGKKVVLNIFPSIDTDVCAASVRQFN
ncbi:MAG: redoxin family protein, partial [Desulfobulbus sp.]|nr:redoxin family protein [Desulfobulbus sp.]